MKTTNSPRRNRVLARFIALLALAGLAVACGENAEDLSDEELRDRLIEVLTEDDTMTTTEATCITDGLFDSAERDQINRMANADTAADITPEDESLLFDVMVGCI